ncbi:MAG: hypothetical protein JXR03_02925 [Cyclobacteriaceae bacterium]
MMKQTILVLLLSMSSGFTFAQDGSEKIILKAIRDEIDRNMNELQLEDHEKPFFISYAVTDMKQININAMLGGVFNSSLDSARGWSTRVMVGGYHTNDENYYDAALSINNGANPNSRIPIDDNYEGIRRSLWLSTNNIYKSAAKLYKSKNEMLSELELDSLPLGDFSREAIVKKYDYASSGMPDKNKIEAQIAELSSLFLNAPSPIRPSVGFHYVKGDYYFLSSEGMEIVIPIELGLLSTQMQLLDEDQNFLLEQYNAIVQVDEGISDFEQIKGDIQKFIHLVDTKSKTAVFEDLYFGPILIEGELTIDFFMSNLMGGNNQTIVARRSSLSRETEEITKGSISDLEKEIKRDPRRIAKPNLSVYEIPHLKNLNGIELMGHFSMDAEGIVPPDTLKLIEKGKLLTQLNGRTPSVLAPKSNGHKRLNVGYGMNAYGAIAPGVLSINWANPVNKSKLKKDLINEGSEMQLEYVLRVAPVNFQAGSSSLYKAYKVNINTGEETEVRINNINFTSSNSLMRIAGMSDQTLISNEMYGSGGYGASGVPISIILPDAMLLDGFEHDNSRNGGYNYSRYSPSLPSPLEK